ncbi:FadR/GntR family transcriptional regulator [Clostridium brassicae]|uniref:FadR/GntR family transcriptional regulator n=1 Tax=Clostridium brassicae TaxID=2999072 RepID=A0ABT4DE35_9CLOT|nr:FadR/GntR family transcriptional regulator [Clostridium brassicae]MCY6960443.1 FadR/GntR family transcriptional regulator [Clostridium brassicae]
MFSTIKTVKVYEEVILQIKGMVNSGKLKKGDKLISERELSNQLGVSRTSVREALRGLEVIGLIDCKQGEGNFIKKDFESNFFEPLSIMFTLNKSSTEEILELRRVIEVETVALAAKNITNEELIELKNLMDEMKRNKDEELKGNLDKKFHYKIAQASRNNLIVTVLDVISSLIDSFIKDARADILKKENDEEIIHYHHECIYNALIKGDAEEAASIMRMHMKLISQNILK